ncbi:hypothetical protein [Kordiimonas sp.]|uniref:hypothetical protein n=1 Tax=Kordiimonas sp. TaxID=1970157 RepID=UPI003A91C3E8
MNNSKQPAYLAYSVTNTEQTGKSIWTRIGVVWPHKNEDGFTLQLDCVPLDGRLVLREPKARTKSEDQ